MKRWHSSSVKPGRGVEARQVLPGAGALADLLGELALGRVERALPLLVELAGRQLEQRLLVHGLARLADQVERLAVVRHDADGARMLDDLALGLLAVVVAEAVHADPADPALPDDLAADALHRSTSAICAATRCLGHERERHVEHRLERLDGHRLVRLVVALGAVREVHHREPRRDERRSRRCRRRW